MSEVNRKRGRAHYVILVRIINQYDHISRNTYIIFPRNNMDRVKRIRYLSPMRAAKVQASLRIRAVSPEPSLLAHTSSESRGTFRQKARSLVPLNGLACAVKICHDGMLEDTNSLDGAHIIHIKAIANCFFAPLETGIYNKILESTFGLV